MYTNMFILALNDSGYGLDRTRVSILPYNIINSIITLIILRSVSKPCYQGNDRHSVVTTFRPNLLVIQHFSM